MIVDQAGIAVVGADDTPRRDPLLDPLEEIRF